MTSLFPWWQDIWASSWSVGEPQSEGGTFLRVLSASLVSPHLTGVGVGAFTCLTGDGDCWRPAATLATSRVGDLEVGLGRTLGGAL